jgi:hypothetical protein
MDTPEPDPNAIVTLLQGLPRVKITPETITQHTIDKWYEREREYRAENERLREALRLTDAMRAENLDIATAAINRAEKAEADLKNMTGSRNGANAMMGVHKRRADNLRTQLDHAKAALAGDNEAVRLWMLDCAATAERFRERADIWQTAAERAEASLEILHTELAGELPLMDFAASVQRDPADREAAVARVARIRAALADPDDQTKDTP